jgi:hypothetical protein
MPGISPAGGPLRPLLMLDSKASRSTSQKALRSHGALSGLRVGQSGLYVIGNRPLRAVALDDLRTTQGPSTSLWMTVDGGLLRSR